jgi:hypothetical protein
MSLLKRFFAPESVDDPTTQARKKAANIGATVPPAGTTGVDLAWIVGLGRPVRQSALYSHREESMPRKRRSARSVLKLGCR